MAGQIEVKGFVLRSSPIFEADKRLVILTKERGRISCFARGAARPKSKLFAAGRAFIFGDFSLYEGKSSYSLKEANISNYFDGIITDYESSLYASYFAEIAMYYSREGLEAGDAINLLYSSFNALMDDRLNKKLIKAAYEVRAVYDSGEAQQLTKIIPNPASIRQGAIDAYNYSLSASYASLFNFTLSKESEIDFVKIGEAYIEYAIEGVKGFKSYRLLKDL